MLIKLPINIDNKIQMKNFKITINKDTIYIDSYFKDKFLKLILFNNYFGYYDFGIYFPLTFKISNNMIYNEYFFLFALMYEDHELNSLYLIEQKIQSINKKIYFPKLKDYIMFKTLCESISYKETHTNMNEYLHYIYTKIIYSYTIALTVIYLEYNNKNIDTSNKIQSIIKKIKSTNLLYFGLNKPIGDHIYLIGGNEIQSNTECFIKSNLKTIKVFVSEINDNSYIVNNKCMSKSKYSLLKYTSDDALDIRYLLLVFLKNNNNNIVSNVIFKKNQKILNLVPYFNDYSFNNVNIENENILYPGIFNEYYYCTNNFNFKVFKTKVDSITFNNNVMNKLLDNYTYPNVYNKNELDDIFKKICYYIYLFPIETKSIKISKNKIKFLYNTVYKLIVCLKNNNTDILNNYKIYSDKTYINIFLNLIKYPIFDIEESYKTFILSVYLDNIKNINILNLLSWDNFNTKIKYFNYLLELKENKNKLIFYENKLNNFVIETILDYKLKKTLVDPIYLYSFLKKEQDFIKWTLNLKNYIHLFFYNTFKISKDEVKKLGKIIYLLFKIDNQDMNNPDYYSIIKKLKHYKSIIIFNDRINIKIKDIIKNNKINMGFLVKHIVSDINESITIENSSDEDDEHIKNITSKYYKYKTKYLSLKMSDMSSEL